MGTGTIIWLRKTAYVAGIATKPEVRGRGIASRILALLGEQARRRNRAWLALDVEGENETAQRVYRKAGYREIARYTWFTRNDLPPTGAPVPPGVRPVKRADWEVLAPELDRSRPPEYRSAFPARARVISHNEFLVRSGHARVRTWFRRANNGAACFVRVYFVLSTRMAIYFPMSTLPEPPSEEFAGLFEAATQWLRARSPSRSIAVAAQPRGAIAESLERQGFTGVVSSAVMIRESAP